MKKTKKPPDPWPDVPDPDFEDGGFLKKSRLAGRGLYEDQAIRRLCTKLGCSPLYRRVASEAEDRTGTFGCSFGLFNEMSGFPVRLVTGNLRGVRFITLPDLFNKFHRTPVGFALAEVCEHEDPADGPVAMVFRWSGLQDEDGKQQTIKNGKFMAAHTIGFEHFPGVVGVSAMMVLAGRQHSVTVQRFDDVLYRYAGWRSG